MVKSTSRSDKFSIKTADADDPPAGVERKIAERGPSSPAVRLVFLVGFMGAGKTTVGRALSDYLGWAFADLDHRIEVRAERSIERIFEESGESAFRQMEYSTLQELLLERGSSPAVIALGGGSLHQADLAALTAEQGVSVFLDAPVEVLFERCRGEATKRPLAGDIKHFQELYEARLPIYRTARVHIDTLGKDAVNIAAEVAELLQLQKFPSSGGEK